MNFSYLFEVASTFLAIIEGLVFVNIFLSIIVPRGKIRRIFEWSIEPILTPIRFFIKRSVIRISGVDISYIITYVVVSYLRMLIR